MKSYMTRVGEGPMPSEQDNTWGQSIRERGNEYGTVTKRPRRVGYLDLALLGYTSRITGVTDLAVTLFRCPDGRGRSQDLRRLFP